MPIPAPNLYPPFNIVRLSHVELAVTDLARSRAFYVDTLGLQVTPSQQPLGHEVASHTQLPPRHRCPAAHAGPVPHAQAPPTQASANTGSQAMQAAPAVPHATEEGSLHIEPEQQPVGHPAAQVSQTPPTQSPPPQLSQLPPPAPHALGVSPGWHAPARQQPAQDRPSQTQVPASQR